MTDVNTDVQDTDNAALNANDTADANVVQVTTTDNAVDKAAFDKLLSEKRKANREAQEIKKELAELKAKEDERKEKEMTEVELSNKKAQEAVAAKEALERRLAHTERTTLALKAGVSEQYTDYAAGELEKAGTDVDPKEWFITWKESNPAFFNGDRVRHASAEGGHAATGNQSKLGRVEEINKKLESLFAVGRKRTDQAEVEAWKLKTERDTLLEEMNK
jgi:hypothetical protein